MTTWKSHEERYHCLITHQLLDDIKLAMEQDPQAHMYDSLSEFCRTLMHEALLARGCTTERPRRKPHPHYRNHKAERIAKGQAALGEVNSLIEAHNISGLDIAQAMDLSPARVCQILREPEFAHISRLLECVKAIIDQRTKEAGIRLRRVRGRDAVCTRSPKLVGKLQPGDVVIHSTGPDPLPALHKRLLNHLGSKLWDADSLLLCDHGGRYEIALRTHLDEWLTHSFPPSEPYLETLGSITALINESESANPF